MGDTASGGEISRIMLVLKCILAGRIGLPTIIFDEIDTGVSGDVAARIGRLMAEGGAAMQIVTITTCLRWLPAARAISRYTRSTTTPRPAHTYRCSATTSVAASSPQ